MDRLFVACPLPDDITERLLATTAGLPSEGVRITIRQNLHITLFFIGEVPSEETPLIQEELKKNLSGFEAFTLRLRGIEIKKTKQKPSMIWARFGDSEPFSRLNSLIRSFLSSRMTQPPSHVNPVPHCTLARIKKTDLGSWIPPAIEPFFINVNRAELWLSRQSKDGVRYEKLSHTDFVPDIGNVIKDQAAGG